MNRLKNGLSFINKHTGGLQMLSLFGALLPIALLLGVGLYTIIKQGYTFYLVVLLLVSSLPIMIQQWLYRKQLKSKSQQPEPESFVEPLPDWSDKELAIWDRMNTSITDKLAQDDEWAAMKKHGLALALEVANAFGKKELDFTLLEGLQLIEEIGRQYREVLDENFPVVDLINVSSIKHFYDNYDNYRGIFGIASDSWRIARFAADPISALVSEAKGQILEAAGSSALDRLQKNAKRILLQEVVKVCINLYSGRFVPKPSSLALSKAHQQDKDRMAEPVEPVRVVLVGQVSAGKSSVVNALLKNIQAEVDALPSTNKVNVYPCMIDGVEELRLVDMAGLDGSQESFTNSLEQITQSDLVFWLLKANQSARDLDVKLQQILNAFYAKKENISRKRPRIVAIINQVDNLKPVDEWYPPYDLSDSTNAKTKVINEAIAFNRSQLTLADAFYALAVPENKAAFGVEQLEAEIQCQYEHAKNVQLNRRRHEAKTVKGFSGQVKRLFHAGIITVKNIS